MAELGGQDGRLTEIIEVQYVHATIEAEGSTEGVGKDGGGRGEEGRCVFIPIFQFLPAIITRSDSSVCPCLFGG